MPPAKTPQPPTGRALLDTPQAAEYLNVAAQTLCIWRGKGTGPRFLRLGNGTRCAIRYKITDLDAYIEACAVQVAA